MRRVIGLALAGLAVPGAPLTIQADNCNKFHHPEPAVILFTADRAVSRRGTGPAPDGPGPGT